MKTIDSLLRQAADHPRLPARFADRVQKALLPLMERRKRWEVFSSGVLLSGSLLLFFYALSLLIVDIITAPLADIANLALEEPGILTLRESWLALFENFPFSSAALTLVALIPVCIFLRRIATTLPHGIA